MKETEILVEVYDDLKKIKKSLKDFEYIGLKHTIDEYYYDFEVTENAKRRIPRSTTLDLGFEHSFMNQRLFISGKVKNITDAKVISEFNRPLPGRSFGMKIRYIFK